MGYSVNVAGDGCMLTSINCPPDFRINSAKNQCIPAPNPAKLAYFPLLISAIFFAILSFFSYKRDRESKPITSIIAFLSILWTGAIIYQIINSAVLTAYGIFTGLIISYLLLIGSNIFFFIFYMT